MIDLGKMVAYIEEGLTVNEIKLKFDCSDKTVRVWVKKLPIEYKAKLKSNGRQAQLRSRKSFKPALNPNLLGN